EVGASDNPAICAGPAGVGSMLSVASSAFADVAVITADSGAPLTEVATENWPLVCPAGITMLDGTVACGLLLARLTNTPPAAAGSPRTSGPGDDCAAVTGFGDRLRPPSSAKPAEPASIVNGAVMEFAAATRMFAVFVVVDAKVVTTKLPTV